MKPKNIIAFLVVCVIIVGLVYVSAFDVTIGDWKFPSALDEEYGIKKGLDLVGGSVIVFEPDLKEGEAAPTGDDIATVEQILRTRLDSASYFDATLARQAGNGIRVEIPNISDPNEASALLGKVAKLTFVDYQGNLVMDGTKEFIKDAQAVYGPTEQGGMSSHHVVLTLTGEGQKAFADATARISQLPQGQNIISIKLDEEIVSSPQVSQTINSSDCVITGQFTQAQAQALASQIRSGSLPFNLKEVELRSVGPTLGAEALDKGVLAGGIGFLLVVIFMLLVYRAAGLVADISLVAYIGVFALIMVKTGATLTLPGIAGVILSIGMAVDANCVIFERIKEELGTGKTIGAAIDSAFNRAIVAVIDANITTIIAAVVLYYLGTGPVKGFALTLLIGTIVSMLTAIVVTKFNLKQIVKGFGLKSPNWFGKIRRLEENETV